MNDLGQSIGRFLRGPSVSALLRKCGIDPVRYWLLIDLFGELSERRELFSQLGRDGMTLQKAAWAYYLLSALLVLMFIVTQMALATYFAVFLGMTTFLLFSMLLSETSNSLVNPVEGLVLAHQPINGATYTGAKLTHLLRLLLHLVPGLNLVPAVAALTLKGCPWYYPLLHMASAFAVGLVVALCCCAIFGWLIRFVPPPRLKAVGFFAEMCPWLFYMSFQFSRSLREKIHIPNWLPSEAGPRRILAGVVCAIAVGMVVFGIRALSGDYLVRVSAIAHGGSRAKSRAPRTGLGFLVARLVGGPSARAGYEYVSHMMARDWQFRRQMIPLIPVSLMAFAGAFTDLRISPFSGTFTAMHFFPHAFGILFFIICNAITYGNDHKGVWLFLLAPAGAFRGFAHGVYARLFSLVAVPQLILLAIAARYWGVGDAALFLAYGLMVSLVYLGLELRLIHGMPFGRQPEASQNTAIIPMMLLGGAVMGVAVAIQHFLLFRAHTAVVIATLVLAGAAWFVTRSSMEAFEISMRFHLGMLSTESKGLLTEIDV